MLQGEFFVVLQSTSSEASRGFATSWIKVRNEPARPPARSRLVAKARACAIVEISISQGCGAF